jgi:hypothetical protein
MKKTERFARFSPFSYHFLHRKAVCLVLCSVFPFNAFRLAKSYLTYSLFTITSYLAAPTVRALLVLMFHVKQ